jgi:hypothetical protein
MFHVYVPVTFPLAILKICREQVLDDEEDSLANELGVGMNSKQKKSKGGEGAKKKGERHSLNTPIIRLLITLYSCRKWERYVTTIVS